MAGWFWFCFISPFGLLGVDFTIRTRGKVAYNLKAFTRNAETSHETSWLSVSIKVFLPDGLLGFT
jgi:hypothetical protein